MNADIGMSKGKAVSQGCHAACNVTRILERNKSVATTTYKSWIANGETKIVLKCNENEMKQLIREYGNRFNSNIWCVDVLDAGKTEVCPGTLTAIAFNPLQDNDIPEQIRKMKIY